LKIKIKPTKEFKTKNQNRKKMTKFKKITNNNYEFKGEIENNLKFDKKRTMNKN
jgi:hypothetical protein